jgi:hypothetical protein
MADHFADCDVSDNCFECPLTMCKYDNPAEYRRWKTKNLDKVMLATINAEGLTVNAAAQKFRVTPRTIDRIKRRNL